MSEQQRNVILVNIFYIFSLNIFIPFSSVSVVDFEQVIIFWVLSYFHDEKAKSVLRLREKIPRSRTHLLHTY